MPSLCAFDDGCQTQPCQNGGTCSSRPEGAQCACPSGFTGLACQRLCVEGADSDGDGILDCEDACPHDDSKAEDDDTDGDLTVDCMDACPHDPLKAGDVDSDSDGILDCNECIVSVDDPTRCFVVHETPRPWPKAQSICEQLGGGLASIKSQAESDQLWSLAYQSPAIIQAIDFWLGLHKDDKGVWRWSDGGPVYSPQHFRLWNQGEPNADGDCAGATLLDQNVPGGWNNFWCESAHPYVCELPNPDNPVSCPAGWRGYNDRCILLNELRVSWHAAKDMCDDMGAHLLADFDNDVAIMEFVNTFSPSFGGEADAVWVGANDIETEGTYVWVTNTTFLPLGSPFWLTGEPNNHLGDEHCVELHMANGLNDNRCLQANPFVCELPNYCAPSPCLNGASCTSTLTEAVCSCPSGFTGATCAMPCSSSVDSDGDGVADCSDACPSDASTSASPDSDGDGVVDCMDACPHDASKINDDDTDGNGVPDCTDCPSGWMRIVHGQPTCIKHIAAKLGYADARDHCENLGGRLATVHGLSSLAKLDPTASLGTVWAGFHVWDSQWVQPDGNGLSPNQQGMVGVLAAQDCLTLQPPHGGVVASGCNAPYSSICEIPIASRNSCLDGWTSLNGRCVQLFDAASYYSADATCKSQGSRLITMNTADDWLALTYQLTNRGTHELYLGLSDSWREGSFVWSDGTQADSLPWSSGQPDNYNNNEDCVHVYEGTELNDLSCWAQRPFACEFDDACAAMSCGANSTACVAKPSGAECQCLPGFTGRWCDRRCNSTQDTDGDGVNDCDDACPNNSELKIDADTDGDGYPDCMDLCPRDSTKHHDIDSNADGSLDCNDCVESPETEFACFQHQTMIATYKEAVQDCQAQGKVLASPTTYTEDLAVWTDVVASNPASQDVWVGVDRLVDGQWRTQDGLPAPSMWSANQPSGDGRCAATSHANGYSGWFTTNCEMRLRYVCQDRASTCIAGFTAVSGTCLAKIDQPRPWSAAHQTCESHGMQLLSIHNWATEVAARALVGDSQAWIGASRTPSFTWSDNSAWDFSAWASGQPDNSAVQKCTSVSSFGWDDDYCATPQPYFCYFPDVCPTEEGECGHGGRCQSTPDGSVCLCPYGIGGPKCEDLCGFDPTKETPGVCGCGNPDIDSDGDFVLDCLDACPFDVNRTSDIDSDLDGVLDCNDQCPNDASLIQSIDSDGDGILDCNDQCPDDATRVTSADRDDDGVVDCVDDCPDDPRLTESPDPDGDGFPNCVDNCPINAIKTEPGLCGCEFEDNPENLADSDGDFIVNCVDGCPLDVDKVAPGVCGCGIPDADSDSDGVADCDDECPADAGKAVAGICGCSLPDIDSDGDGTPDCFDACAADALKVAPGLCGCGIPEGTCGATHAALVVGGVASTAGAPAIVAGTASTTNGMGGDDAFVSVLSAGTGSVEAVWTVGGPGDDVWLAAAVNGGATSADRESIVLAGRTSQRPAALSPIGHSSAAQEGMVVLYDSLDAMLAGATHRWATFIGHQVDNVHAEVAATAVVADQSVSPVIVAHGLYHSGRLQVGGIELPDGGAGSVFVAGMSSVDGSVLWATVVHDATASGAVGTIAGAAAASPTPAGAAVCLSSTDGTSTVVLVDVDDGSVIWQTTYKTGTCSGVAQGPLGELVVTGQVTGPVAVNGVLAHDVDPAWGPQGFLLSLLTDTGSRLSSETFGGADPATNTRPHALTVDPTEAGSHAIVVGAATGPIRFGETPSLASPVPPSGDTSTADAFVSRFTLRALGSGHVRAYYRNGDAGHEEAADAALAGDAIAIVGSVLSSAASEARVGRVAVAPHAASVATLHWVTTTDAAAFGESAVSSWSITGASKWHSVATAGGSLAVAAGSFSTTSAYVGRCMWLAVFGRNLSLIPCQCQHSDTTWPQPCDSVPSG